MSGPWEENWGGPKQEEDQGEGPWNEYAPPTNFKEGVADDVTMFGNIAEGGVRGFVDNVMNIPNAAGEFLGQGLAYPTAAVDRALEYPRRALAFDLASGDPLPHESFDQKLTNAQNTWPMSTLIGGMNTPTSIDIQAGLRAAPAAAFQGRVPTGYDLTSGEGIVPHSEPRELTDMGQVFADARDEILEGVLQRREAHPIGAGAGDVMADVMTVVTGRTPIVTAKRNARLGKMKQPQAPVKEMDPGFRKWADQKINQYKDWFKTSGYEIAETGVEGAVLAALQDEDPLMGAAFGAGTQSVSNLSQHIWEEIPDLGMKPGLTRTGTKAGITAFGIASLVQVFKELTPGGRDRILESEESGYRKAAVAMAVGAMTQAAGFGRPSKTQLDDLGLLVDTWHSARRASVMSLVSEMENDDSGDVARVWTQMAQDPSYFDTTANRRLTRAFEDDEISMTGAIESLMEADRKFRRKVIALRDQRDTAPFDRTRERFDQGVDFMSDRMDRLIEE